ncbi:E3 ubiquitin-protein ligase bre1 [Apophysomyces sp. BC1015]|nr:E3 ubiquitin-protein ligase bre1 [Apophysomyces sp. BC1015]
MSSRSSSPPHAREQDQGNDDGQEDSMGIFDEPLEAYRRDAIVRQWKEYMRTGERWKKRVVQSQEALQNSERQLHIWDDRHMWIQNDFKNHLTELESQMQSAQNASDETILFDDTFNEDWATDFAADMKSALKDRISSDGFISRFLNCYNMWSEKRERFMDQFKSLLENPTLKESKEEYSNALTRWRNNQRPFHDLSHRYMQLMIKYFILTEELLLNTARLQNTDNTLRDINIELTNAKEKFFDKNDTLLKLTGDESNAPENIMTTGLKDQTKNATQDVSEPSQDPLIRMQQTLDQQLREVELMKERRVALKHQICQLEVDLVAIPGSRIYKTTLGRQLYQSREYHKDKCRNVLSLFEKVRRDLEESQGNRRRFVKELDAKQVSHIKGLEEQLRRLETDLTRIRGQRDALQVQLEEHKTCAESGRISVNELRVIMETRMERALCLEIEVSRLQRKNVAMLGDRKIYHLIASGSFEEQAAEALREKLRLMNDHVSELKLQLMADIRTVDDAASLLDDELRWTIKANHVQEEADRFTERYGFEPSMTDKIAVLETLQAKIEAIQSKMKEANQKVARLESTEKQFLGEIQSVAKAYDELEEQNMAKIQTLRRTEDDIMSLQLKRFKYSQTFTALNKSKDSYTMVANALTKQVEKQLAYIKQLNEREKNLTGQITALDRDLNAGNAASQIYIQKISEVKGVIKELEEKIYLTKRKVEESESSMKEKIQQFEDEAYVRKRLDENNELLRRKLEVTRKVDSPAEMKLRKERDEYRALLNCSSCRTRLKSHVLMRCMHTFCKECLDTRIETRQRRCPSCSESFGVNDVKQFYF